jgi:hypothetical protein
LRLAGPSGPRYPPGIHFYDSFAGALVDIETKAESANKKLNNMVAVTVVVLSVFLAVSKIKDDNIVQAIQAAKADSVDAWAEYQSARLKLHLAEAALQQARIAAAMAGADQAVIAEERRKDEQAIKTYGERSQALMAKAQGLEKSIESLNFKDDQFDLSDALISIAIAVAAVSALIESWWLLAGLAWVAGGLGIVMGFAGFAGWDLHPDFIIKLLT